MIYAELFADLIASQVGCSIYVNGGNGEDLLQMTDSQRAAFLDKREIADSGHTKAQNKARCEALFLKLKAQGFKVIRAFDCSGLIYWALKQLFPSQKDKRARDFYDMCDPSTDRTGMRVSDLQCGDLVFKHDGKKITHVGVYFGNLKIVDCAGRDLGTVKRSITSDFTRFGRLSALQKEVPASNHTTAPSPAKKQFVRVKGKKTRTVHVRIGPGKSYDKIMTAHGGNTFPLLGRAVSDPRWYNIECNGRSDAWITDNTSYTEIVEV